MRWRLGLCLRPHWGSLRWSPDPLSMRENSPITNSWLCHWFSTSSSVTTDDFSYYISAIAFVKLPYASKACGLDRGIMRHGGPLCDNQTVQNTLACTVTKTPKHHHITPVLKSLHWLKVPQHIHYKIVFLTYNTLYKPINPHTYANYSPSNCLGLFAHHYIFLYLGLQSHPLWSSVTAP